MRPVVATWAGVHAAALPQTSVSSAICLMDVLKQQMVRDASDHQRCMVEMPRLFVSHGLVVKAM